MLRESQFDHLSTHASFQTGLGGKELSERGISALLSSQGRPKNVTLRHAGLLMSPYQGQYSSAATKGWNKHVRISANFSKNGRLAGRDWPLLLGRTEEGKFKHAGITLHNAVHNYI